MQDSFHARIQNWARHYRTTHIKRPTPSLEGRYRPPRGAEIEWETEPAKAAPLPPTDPFDAQLIEDAWLCIPNRKMKLFLRLHYCYRLPWSRVRRKCSLSDGFEQNLLMADAALALSIQEISQNGRKAIAQVRKRIVVSSQFDYAIAGFAFAA